MSLSGSAKESFSPPESLNTEPVAQCEDFCALVAQYGGLTISFQGDGSCLGGKEIDFPSCEAAQAGGFIPLACTSDIYDPPAIGVRVYLESTGCGTHHPPCCLTVPGPGAIPVVEVGVIPVYHPEATGSPFPNERMKGCTSTLDGFPYSMQMCTDQGGGGAPIVHVDTCLCLKGGPLTARVLL